MGDGASTREASEALCRGARPWSRLDRGTARNTWFARADPCGLRLARTGPIGGHVQVHVVLTAAGNGGTRVEMTAGLPVGFFLLHGVFWLLLAFLLWADGVAPRTLCYAWLPLFSLWQGRTLTTLLPEVERELRARVRDRPSH